MASIGDLFQIFVSEWPDLLWPPVALLIVHKGQKLKAMFFIIVCIACLRLQMEIMASTGYTKGFTGYFQINSFHRGLIVYAIFIAGYLLLSYLSPFTRGAIYLAASLSIFFVAFVASSIIMIV